MENAIKKIVFIESHCKSYEHSPINAALIKDALFFFKNVSIVVYAEKRHISAIKELLEAYNTDNVVYKIIKVEGNKSFFYRLLIDYLAFIKIFKNINKSFDGQTIVVLNSMSETNLIVMKTIMPFFKKINTIIIPHGILSSYVYGKRSLRMAIKKLFLNIVHTKKVSYMILGRVIKDELVKEIPSIEKKVFFVNHPYIYNKNIIKSSKKCNDPLKIGFLGVGSKIKGIDIFFNIATEFVKSNSSIQFHLIGELKEKRYKSTTLPNVFLHAESGMLSKEKMDSIALTMDYLIFLLDPNDYKLRASGTFMDAINYEIPIIAIKNNFISHYFDNAKEMGFLCNDKNEVVSLLMAKDNLSIKNHDDQITSIVTLKKQLFDGNVFSSYLNYRGRKS